MTRDNVRIRCAKLRTGGAAYTGVTPHRCGVIMTCNGLATTIRRRVRAAQGADCSRPWAMGAGRALAQAAAASVLPGPAGEGAAASRLHHGTHRHALLRRLSAGLERRALFFGRLTSDIRLPLHTVSKRVGPAYRRVCGWPVLPEPETARLSFIKQPLSSNRCASWRIRPLVRLYSGRGLPLAAMVTGGGGGQGHA